MLAARMVPSSDRASHTKSQSCNRICPVSYGGAPSARRRPQWRGDRRAVPVRLPVPVAQRLVRQAATAELSLSETEAKLIARGLSDKGQGS